MIERFKFSTSTYCTRSYIVRRTVLLSAPTPVQYVPHPNISLFSDENVLLRNINREGNVQLFETGTISTGSFENLALPHVHFTFLNFHRMSATLYRRKGRRALEILPI